MRAGSLRRRCALQAPIDDGRGGFSLGWSTQITVWGEVISPIGPEMPLAEETDVTHQVNIRYYAALTPHWRIIVDGLELHIRSIQNPDGHRRELTVMCSLANFPHPLILQQDVQAGTDIDPYGQPVLVAPTETAFMGWIVARSVTEIVQANNAGVSIGSHLLVAPPTLPITKDDHLRWNVNGDPRIYEAGGDPIPVRHHLETDLRLVTA
jgi:SPP1 family predicted phage head-tail adaptor